jgi:hypothetical protein
MRKIFFVLSVLLFLLAGCAAYSVVEQIGPETFKVSRQADTDFSGLSILRVEALEEAYKYCSRQNKHMRVDTITEYLPPHDTRGLPRAEVQFMCLQETEARLTGAGREEPSDKVIEIKLKKP